MPRTPSSVSETRRAGADRDHLEKSSLAFAKELYFD